jgi:hypothetical protein
MSLTAESKLKIKELTDDISREISNDGKCLGVVGGYDFDDRKAKIGLRITFNAKNHLLAIMPGMVFFILCLSKIVAICTDKI